MRNVLLCLATQKGFEVLREAVKLRETTDCVVSVCAHPELDVAESFYEPICALTKEAGLRLIPLRSLRIDPVGTVVTNQIDSIICISWRYLIPSSVVSQLKGDVTIAHDSLLPRLRGFAPLPTALIIGEQRTGVTFLRAASAVDEGDILWQGGVPIGPKDTIHDLIEKVAPLYAEGARRFLLGELREASPQDHTLATYSIWRDKFDYRIRWTESAERIERTIRALGRPYTGACTRLSGKTIVIEESELFGDLDFAIRQPGKIWSLDASGRPIVVCGSGLLRILSAKCGETDVFPLKTIRQRFDGDYA